jgi:hypothetical protein
MIVIGIQRDLARIAGSGRCDWGLLWPRWEDDLGQELGRELFRYKSETHRRMAGDAFC